MDGFIAEAERLRAAQAAAKTAATSELQRLEARRSKLVNLVLDDRLSAEDAKAELEHLADQRGTLQAVLAVPDAPPVITQALGALYREQLDTIELAFQHEDEATKAAARTALRAIVSAVRIPAAGLLTVSGELPTTAGGTTGSAVVGYGGCGGGI